MQSVLSVQSYEGDVNKKRSFFSRKLEQIGPVYGVFYVFLAVIISSHSFILIRYMVVKDEVVSDSNEAREILTMLGNLFFNGTDNESFVKEYAKKTPAQRAEFQNNMTIFKSILRTHCDHPMVQSFAKLTLVQALDFPGARMEGTPIGSGLPIAFKILFTIIFTVVGCVGVVGNMLTIVVISKTPSLHSLTNYFLANLAISDFFLIVIGVPFDVINIWMNGDPPPIWGYCEMTSTCISTFTFASILTIVTLTAERLQAICYPLTHHVSMNRKRTLKIIYFLWGVAVIPSIYIGLSFKRVAPDLCGYNQQMNYVGSCDMVTGPNSFTYQFELMLIVTFFMPLAFILFCYMRILVTLSRISANTTVHTPLGTQNSDSAHFQFPITRANQTSINSQNYPLTLHTKNYQPPPSIQAQKMVIKMLITVSGVFFLCYLPYHLQRLIVKYTTTYCSNSLFCALLYPLTGVLQYVSATLNPVFYNLMSNRFRTGFKTLIKNVMSRSDKEYSNLARV